LKETHWVKGKTHADCENPAGATLLTLLPGKVGIDKIFLT
jgi:hypothetical protein